MTGDEATLSQASGPLAAFLDALPAGSRGPAAWTGMLPAQNEALLVPTQVRTEGQTAGGWKAGAAAAHLAGCPSLTAPTPNHQPLLTPLLTSSSPTLPTTLRPTHLLSHSTPHPTTQPPLFPQVNYVCKAANLYEDAGYALSGSSYVITKSLGTSWLWDRVRVSGGAYGGFCDFDTHSGMFTYSSYRDPNLLKTVDVYDGTVDFLRNLHMSRDELTKAIIGTIGDVDAYQLPDSKGRTAFMRHILGITDAERQQRRDEVLSTSAADFHAFADALEAVRTKGRVVAVTSADKLEAAHAERPGFFADVRRVV